jgi:RNA polymerase sigma-70 factor (ECF subfamily)
VNLCVTVKKFLKRVLFKIPFTRRPKQTDEELIAEFSSTGDLELLGELYSGYMHLVYGVCLKYLKDREESSDAVMQIFEKLIDEIPKHKIENFRSWLYVVTKNFCLMQLRSQKSKSEKLEEWINDSAVFMENSSVMHPIDEEKEDLDKSLSECIENLKTEQKECIRQFYFENRCYKEIASVMGLDENKVKSHLQNAKRNLKICLEEKNGQKV